MGLDLGYERLAIQRCETENMAETVVEGSVTLPEGAPEIGRALKMWATPRVTEMDVKDGKVVFEGTVDLELLYVNYEEHQQSPEAGDGADDDEGGQAEIIVVERLTKVSWDDELPWAYVLELPGVEEGAEVESSVTARQTSVEVRSDQVTVDVDIALLIGASVHQVHQVTAATSVRASSDIEVESRSVRVRNHLGSTSGSGVVEAQLAFAGRATPGQILSLMQSPEVTEVSVLDGRVRVRGVTHYGVLFLDEETDGPGFAEWRRGGSFDVEIPFSGARAGLPGTAVAQLGEARFSVVNSDEAVAVKVESPVTITARLEQAKEVALTTGLSSEERDVATRIQSIRLVEAVGEGTLRDIAEASLEIPANQPGAARALWGEARAVVDDVHVLGDKVAIELHVDVDALYVSSGDGDEGVYVASWPGAFSLDLEVPVDGAEPGLERNVNLSVERTEVRAVGSNSIEVKVNLRADVELSREVDVEAVAEAVEIPPADANPPTYTFVVIEPGDTLWKVAARYRSSSQAILGVNPWLESEEGSLPAGKKLCVPRKVPHVESQAS